MTNAPSLPSLPAPGQSPAQSQAPDISRLSPDQTSRLADFIRSQNPKLLSRATNDTLVRGFAKTHPNDFNAFMSIALNDRPLGSAPIKPPGFLETLRGNAQEELEKPPHQIVEDALPAVGGAIGGGLGAPGGPLTAAGGAALGAAGGDAASQLLRRAYGEPAPATSGAAAKELLKNSFMQGVLPEVGGRIITAPFRALTSTRGILRPTTPVDETVLRFLKDHDLIGDVPASIVRSRGAAGTYARMGQKFGEYAIAGRGTIEAARMNAIDKSSTLLNDWLSKFGRPSSPQTVGANYQEAVTSAREMFGGTAANLYQKVDDLAQGSQVNLSSSVAEAKRLLSQRKTLANLYPNLFSENAPYVKALEDVASSPENVPFAIAHQLRSRFISSSPEVGTLFANESQGPFKKLVGTITRDMATTAQGKSGIRASRALSPQALQAYRTASDFWSDGRELFDRTIIPTLLQRNPEAVVAAMKPGAVSDVQAVKDSLFRYTPKAQAQPIWNSFREQFVRSQLLRDPEGEALGQGGQDTASGLFRLKDRLQNYGPQFLATMFDDPQGKTFLANTRALGEVFSRLDRTLPKERTAFIMESLRVPIAILSGMAGDRAGGLTLGAAMGSGIEAFPYAMTKILYSPRATKILTEGLGGAVPLLSKTGAVVPRGVGAAITADFLRAYSAAEKDSDHSLPKEEQRLEGHLPRRLRLPDLPTPSPSPKIPSAPGTP
ncbi:MAG: hypothetical protein KGL39_15895 [Patescibacteria group bacterium]|nr:hypothetical protein [Patescibacteria group bacterium]